MVWSHGNQLVVIHCLEFFLHLLWYTEKRARSLIKGRRGFFTAFFFFFFPPIIVTDGIPPAGPTAISHGQEVI